MFKLSRISRACIAEGIGTFALVFAGTGAIVINELSGDAVTHLGIALTFGLIVMVMVYSIGDVSGAHINPAVTVGFWVSGRFPFRNVVPYVFSQLLGALVASVIIWFLFGNVSNLGATYPVGHVSQSFVLEVILTFFLMFVIICVAIGAKEKGLMAGAAIGGTVGLEALFAGPISGASMNPARSLAPALVSGHFAHQWIYIAAPLAGAVIAVIAYKIIYGDGKNVQLEFI